MADLRTRLVIAGTAGGVGTTTVAALLFSALSSDPLSSDSIGAPLLFDHSGGDLGLRLPEGDDAATVDDQVAIHDLGPHAFGEATALLADESTFLVLVTPATPGGIAEVDRVLTGIRETYPANGTQRTLVVCVGTFGRHRINALTEKLQDRWGRRSLVTVPQDAALAAGGRVPLARLNPETRRAQKQLVGMLRARLANR